MNGAGRYQWVGLDGVLRSGASWEDFPDAMDRVVAFVPDSPPPPHSEAEHAYMETFVSKMDEVLKRCRSVTRVGDADVAHCSGMTRATGSSNVTVNGIAVSRQGDNNTGHLLPPNVPPCPSHSAPIASGSSTVTINGRGCGRVGDSISGCTSVAQGSADVTAGG